MDRTDTAVALPAVPGLELIRPIGRGKVADVFLARDPELGRLVAVKVLRAVADPTSRLRFEREGRATASLTHPGIVQVYRVGATPEGRPFLVMQYVKGRSLEEKLAAEGPLRVDEARRILHQVAEALDASHRRRIVHRDVRLDNILEDEESGRMLLTDFGLAALLESGDAPAERLTAVGQIVGDARFMSPEQIRGEQVTEQADVYQVGVLAHYLLTGGGPFGDLPTARLLAAHLKDPPPSVMAKRASVDADLADLIQRCLGKEPGRRPRTPDLTRRLGGGTSSSTQESSASIGLLGRRLPQFVVGSIVLGLGVMQLASELIQNRILTPVFYPLAIVLAIHGVLLTSVLSWFHGARGEQRVEVLEMALLGGLGVTWLASSIWVAMH